MVMIEMNILHDGEDRPSHAQVTRFISFLPVVEFEKNVQKLMISLASRIHLHLGGHKGNDSALKDVLVENERNR